MRTSGPAISAAAHRRAAWILCALQPLGLLAMYGLFSVDFPLLDQWEFPLFLDKYFAGTLQASDFWAQHNEHRILVPRIVMLLLAVPTGWDVRYELAMNFVLGVLLFGLAVVLLRRVALYGAARPPVYLLPLLSLLIFSLAQWQNWFLGWQLQALLSAAAVTGTVLLASAPRIGARHFGLAMASAFVAIFSFANGLVALPITLLLLTLRRRWWMAGGWLLYSGLLTALYFDGYVRPAYHPDPWAGLLHPVGLAAYTAVYLGQPLIAWNTFLAGAAGAGALLVAGALLWRERNNTALALPLAGLLAYALCSALLTAAARADLGAAQALSPRYVSFANFLWVVLFVLTGLHAGATTKRFVLGGAALLIAMNSLHGAYRWTERAHVYAVVRPALLAGERHPYLRFVYPDADILLERRETLRRLGLSIFREE